MNELKEHLAALDPGPVDTPAGLEPLLAACWDSFEGSDEGGMEGSKLLGRMEQVVWTPPVLGFMIERHGGTVCGSTRAGLQHWAVNFDTKTATITKTGHRQLKPPSPRISVKSVVQEVALAILEERHDDRQHRQADGSIKVGARAEYPDDSGYKQTVAGRRKRLIQEIERLLAGRGWVRSGSSQFSRKSPVNPLAEARVSCSLP